MNSKEMLESALDVLRQLNRKLHNNQHESIDAEGVQLLALLQVEINRLKRTGRETRKVPKKTKSIEKENRSQIKAAFQQELLNLGATRAWGNGGVQNERVLWALEVLGAKSSDHEEELKALYRYLIKKTHPDLAGIQNGGSERTLFESVTKAWEVLKEHNIVK